MDGGDAGYRLIDIERGRTTAGHHNQLTLTDWPAPSILHFGGGVMDKLIAQINEMANMDAINTLNEAITDTVEYGYTNAVVILARTSGEGDDIEFDLASMDSGIDYADLITLLQVTLLKVIGEYNNILDGEDADTDAD